MALSSISILPGLAFNVFGSEFKNKNKKKNSPAFPPPSPPTHSQSIRGDQSPWDTCPGDVSGTRVQETSPGHVSRRRLQLQFPAHIISDFLFLDIRVLLCLIQNHGFEYEIALKLLQMKPLDLISNVSFSRRRF